VRFSGLTLALLTALATPPPAPPAADAGADAGPSEAQDGGPDQPADGGPEPVPAPRSQADGGLGPVLEGTPEALAALRDRLAAWRQGDHARPFRIIQVGDSHTEAAFLPQALARLIADGQPSGPGLVWPGFFAASDLVLTTGGGRKAWKLETWLDPNGLGPYGPRGAAWVTHKPGARLAITSKQTLPDKSRLTLYYAPFPGHRTVEVWSGGKRFAVLAPPQVLTGTLGMVTVPWPSELGAVELRVGGTATDAEFRFYGASVERSDLAVVYDALGVSGTTQEAPLRRGDGAMEDYIRRAQPDLLVVWYGSNSAVTDHFSAEAFRKPYQQLVEQLREAAGRVPTLMIGPPDLERRAEGCGHWLYAKRRRKADPAAMRRFVCEPESAVVRSKNKVVYPAEGVTSAAQWTRWLQSCNHETLPTIDQITQVESQVAEASDSIFFDTFAAMGGEGSIHQWICADPRLAEFDHVHLSREGHARLAQMIAEQLQLVPPGERPAPGQN
jgi:lysophospholipase L1-like esterase